MKSKNKYDRISLTNKNIYSNRNSANSATTQDNYQSKCKINLSVEDSFSLIDNLKG